MKNSRLKAEVEDQMSQGFNKSQATSIAWSIIFEERAAELEAKYQGNFSPNWKFDCYCFDCKKGNQFGAADSMRLFIYDHKDHKTKTMKIG